MLYVTTLTLYHRANGNAVTFFFSTSVKSDEQVLPRPVSVAALILDDAMLIQVCAVAACCTHPLDVMRV